jgi:beta-galactosidase
MSVLEKRGILSLLTCSAAITQLWAAPKPYLPESAPIKPYQSSVIPVKELKIELQNGLKLEPGKFVSERSLNGTWKCSGLDNSARPFAADVDFDKDFLKRDFNDSKWDDIDVPLDWYKKYPKIRQLDKGKSTCSKPFVKGWYRKQIDVSAAELKDRSVFLHFGVAPYEAVLFVNGKEAGKHHGDFTPWNIDITQFLKAGKNTVALRLFSDFGPRFSNVGRSEWTAAGTVESWGQMKAVRAYGSQWGLSNIKGGLWQNVSLRFEPQVYFSRLLINPKLKDSAIDVCYEINNPTNKLLEVDLAGVVVAATKNSHQVKTGETSADTKLKLDPGVNSGSLRIKLDHPELWSPANPFLYYTVLYLCENDKIISADVARFGFREFKVTGRNFYLNGERIYLFGENLPSVRHGGMGDENAEKDRIIKILQGFKSLGYNIIRNAHMPVPSIIPELADEIGVMILDEWAWCFTNQLDEKEFEKNNLAELKEWVYRDYNHPSVVMWCGANEVVFDNNPAVARQLDKQVELIKELDKSNRPVSSFSGSGSWTHYGKEKRKADLIDLHNYLGLASAPWTCWDERFKHLYDGTIESYGHEGKLDMPYIIWECVGFSWGMRADKSFKVNDIHKYAEYAKKTFSWAQPNGIGFSGVIGLDAAVDPKRGTNYGRELYGRRILEQIRYNNTEIQGFAPWFHGHNLKMATLWTQPVFCGMRNPGSIMLRNTFAGREYTQELFIVNSTNNNYKNVQFELQLVVDGDKKVDLLTCKADSVKAWERFSKQIKFTIPAECPIGWSQIRITAKDGEQEISRNYYNIFVQTPDILTKPIKSQGKIAVIDAASPESTAALMKVMQDLKLETVKIEIKDDLKGYKLIIIPPDAKISAMDMNPLHERVHQGATLLVLEQKLNGVTFLPSTMLVRAENTFVDLVIPAHPVFEGLTQDNFDTWNNPDHGFAINTMMTPFSINALAVRGPLLGERNIGNAISEGTLGKGRVFNSQLCAVELWGKDASASTYLRNLINYVATHNEPFRLTLPLEQGGRNTYIVNKKNTIMIDLKPYANRGFSDDKTNDGKGGWTDQGDNDFRTMPLGTQTLVGIPFDIINPNNNQERSCIILGGTQRPMFPKEIKGINVEQMLSRLFFLHTSAWGSKPGQEMAYYQINYKDGTYDRIKLINSLNIADWWSNNTLLGEAKLAVCTTNSQNRQICAFATVWENPYPDKKIASVDFVATGDAVPILIAMTGEKAHQDPLVIENGKGGSWKSIAWKGGEKPETSVVDSPGSPSGKAVKIIMPAKNGHGTPVVMKRFPVEKLKKNNYKSLSFRIRSEGSAILDIVLPIAKWKSNIQTSITLSAKHKQWTRMHFDIREDMGMKSAKKWKLNNLDGELFIYNGLSSGNRPACVIYIDDIRFE